MALSNAIALSNAMALLNTMALSNALGGPIVCLVARL